MVSQGFEVSVPGNKVEAASPFLTWLHKHAESLSPYAVDYKSIKSPPQITKRRQRLYTSREGESKNLWTCVIVMQKPLTVWITINWKILKKMGKPDYLTHLLRNLYAGQEATVRTGHGTTDWFQIGKGVLQECILSPCLFNLYAEYITRNTGLEETQAGIKIAGRNIKTSDMQMTPPLMAESEEELKSLSMKVKEESEKLA